MTARHPGSPTLTARVLVLNTVVMVGAVVLLAFGPATVSSPVPVRELAVLIAGVGAAVVATLPLVRRAFAPLEELTGVMRTIDPLVPGTRVRVRAGGRETRQLAAAFNDMLERLEDERRESARRAVRAQEAERRRLARELHDELGQSLTGVLLQVDHAIRTPDAPRLAEGGETARRSPPSPPWEHTPAPARMPGAARGGRRRPAAASRTCGGSRATCAPTRS